MHSTLPVTTRPGLGRFAAAQPNKNNQPAGYDYHYLGLGWGPGQGDEGSQHEDPLAAPDSL